MDYDVAMAMMNASLSQFHDGTIIYSELEEDFVRECTDDHPFLGIWFLDNLLANQYFNTDELSDFRGRWDKWLKSTEKHYKNNYGELSKEHIEKMRWTFDLFLMKMGSNYIKDHM